MTTLKRIVHFDTDSVLKGYLKKNTSDATINDKTAPKIPNRTTIDAFSIKSRSRITPTVLNCFPKLKLIITRTVGTDHIDLKECKKRGIAVYHIQDYGAHTIAEHALALMLTAAKQIVWANKQTHKGKFSYEPFLSTGLKGKTLGVIGTGRIGLEFIKRAKALEMTILAFDIYKNEKAQQELQFTYTSLDELLKNSDCISIHVPLLSETKHMIAQKQLQMIKKGAIIVNTSRGGIINTKHLIKYAKKFKAICLDVLEDEQSFSKKHPLLQFENVIITPHMAFYSDTSLRVIASETLENIKRFERGDSTNKVC